MMISKIIIGIDNSEAAENAAKYGFNIAQKFNAAVGVVNIIEPTAMPVTPDPLIGVPMQGVGMENMELLDIQKNQSENIVDNIIKKFAGDIKVTHFTDYGPTADGIIKCSKEFKADLIVVGTHSRSGLDRLLKGSVAEHVVRYSEVPVLVVPLKEANS